VDRPVNVLALPGGPPVAELAAAGVARISVGSGFSSAAYGTLVEAATELRDHGTYAFGREPGLTALRTVLKSWRTP
jgi:2-methylisocitrate lyase-like PEP mutase family enzyme